MRLLYVHDGPVYYDETGNYYEYSYHGLNERYSYLADEITFLMRTNPLPLGAKYDKLPSEIDVAEIKNFKSPFLYFRNIKSVRQTIEEEVKKTDILIIRDSSAGNIALKYAKKYSKPYIWECVGCALEAYWNYSILGKLIAPFSFLIKKRNIKNSTYVCYVTDKFLQGRYPTKGKSISCSDVVIDDVDENILEKRLEKIKAMSDASEIKIGTAAAIDVKYKGQQYVMEAIRILKDKGIHAKYYLAGGGNSGYLKDYASKLKITDEVVFLGQLNKNEIIDLYDDIDIYIQPSMLEGLPRSVIEALSRACPTLGTNVGGIPELIGADCLFKKGNSKEIAALIEKMIAGSMNESAGRNFYKAKDYTMSKLEKKRKDFYDEFLANEIKGNHPL